MATSKLTIDQQIEKKRKELSALEAKKKSGDFGSVIKKHQQSITNIYAELKAATGKQRGVDADILMAVADAMGMKAMTVTKKVQKRKPK
jgi:hypothetical protein